MDTVEEEEEVTGVATVEGTEGDMTLMIKALVSVEASSP